jgi:hypothetical protein
MPCESSCKNHSPGCKIIDLTDPDMRGVFQGAMGQLWLSVTAPARFVDNATVHPRVIRMQSWKSYCENIEEIRKTAESMGSRAIFNFPVHVWYVL